MEYFKPKNLSEAEALKQKFKSSAYLAGGTILNWKGKPKFNALIDLKDLKLNQIKLTKKKIVIGAMITIQEIFENKKLPVPLVLAAKNFNSLNIRNVATIGGNICDIFFVSNLLPILLSYNAKVNYFFNCSTNECFLKDWITEKKEILTDVIIDELDREVFERQERIAGMDVSSIATALGYKFKKNEFKDLLIAISGASANTVLLIKTSEYLSKNDVNHLDELELKKIISKEIKFIENIKISKRVKLNLIVNHLTDILKSI